MLFQVSMEGCENSFINFCTMTASDDNLIPEEHERLSDELESRLKNLNLLQTWGIDPWGVRFETTSSCRNLHLKYSAMTAEELASSEINVSVAGRIVGFRKHGKAMFADLLDSTGTIQLFFKYDLLNEKQYEGADKGPSLWQVLEVINIGDWLGVAGTMMKTRMGELTIRVADLKILSKALRPLPEKYHGLKDKELRYRYRYLDLIANPEIREIFRARTKVIKTIRRILDEREFLEVETPALHKIAGGAHAKPFMTYLNALDLEIHLRISLELYLKRLMIGGFERVYEIGRVFRNEGMDRDHNPEFTLLEVYEAFGDLETMRELTETICRSACYEVRGTYKTSFRDYEIDFEPEFQIEDFNELLKRHADIDLEITRDPVELRKICKKFNLEVEDNATFGRSVDVLFDALVQPNLIQPTFVFNHPWEMSPLAKKHSHRPNFVQRFELFIAGHEMANAFNELNDPLDQRVRFEEQMKLKALGDREAHPIDEDFIYSMEHGMPCAGGMGLGVDRLVMLVTGAHSIRDVIFFPMMR